MPKVTLPPGCYGLAGGGKKTPPVRPGSTITISDEAARAVKASPNGQLGIITATQAVSIGTRKGRRCTKCGFLAQAWSIVCPHCGEPTVPED